MSVGLPSIAALINITDRAFWALLWLSILSLQTQQDQSDSARPFNWQSEFVTVPESANLDTFDWNMGVF